LAADAVEAVTDQDAIQLVLDIVQGHFVGDALALSRRIWL
jgi:hypothetical protein